MERSRPKLTKMYQKKKRIESSNKEIMNYLDILEKRKTLSLTFPKVDEDHHLYKQSWENIFEKTGEKISYFIRHIIFYIQMKADQKEIDNYKNITKGEQETKQIFFESIFNTSKPLDIPFNMSDNDFEKYRRYFYRKK